MSLFYHMNESQKVEEITMKWPVDGYVIPAGTPMSRTGVANNGDAIGILASEARVRFPYPLSIANKIGKKEPKGTLDYEFSVITGGFVNRTEAEAAFGDTYSDAAISAMSGISFVTPESAKLGGSSLKKYTAEKTDGGYLVYGEMGRKPLLERFETLTTYGEVLAPQAYLQHREILKEEEYTSLVGRKIEVEGNVFTITAADSTTFWLDGEYKQTTGKTIYSALEPLPVPAAELTAALASGTVQLECEGETINIGTWTAVEDGKITGGAGGVTSWNDLTDKPFGEERHSIVKGIVDAGPDYIRGFYVTSVNRNKQYTFVIRGDVYENISSYETNHYYNHIQWGIEGWSSDYTEETPFKFWRDAWAFDAEGNFDATNPNLIYGDVGNYEGYMGFEADPERYPNLTLDEVEIYEVSITPIDEKYLPESVSPLIVHFTGDSIEDTDIQCNCSLDDLRKAWDAGRQIFADFGYINSEDGVGITTDVGKYELSRVSLYDDPEYHGSYFQFRNVWAQPGQFTVEYLNYFLDDETGKPKIAGEQYDLFGEV